MFYCLKKICQVWKIEENFREIWKRIRRNLKYVKEKFLTTLEKTGEKRVRSFRKISEKFKENLEYIWVSFEDGNCKKSLRENYEKWEKFEASL